MKLQFHVDGPATIQAVSNANLLSDESFVGNSRTTFRGEAMLILRSTADAGKITVKATAKGVKSATAGIVSVPAVPSLSKFEKSGARGVIATHEPTIFQRSHPH